MVIGHKKQKNFLKTALKNDRLAHAYIFSGPSHIGKKALALDFAQMVLCSKKDKTKSCEKCSSCQMFKKQVHSDFSLVEKEIDKKQISIKAIEKLIGFLSTTSSFSDYKVAVIDNAHIMTHRAQTCLLKTLEEPRGNTILILVTEYPSVLFPTIRSRAQEIKLSNVSSKDITEFLKQQNISIKKINQLLLFASGKPGRVINFLKKDKSIEAEEKQLKILEKVLRSSLDVRFDYAKKLALTPIKENLEIWLNYFRIKLLEKLDKGEEIKSIQKNICLLMRVNFLIRTTNVNKKLLLENLMLAI